MSEKFPKIKKITKTTIKGVPKDKPGVYKIYTGGGKLQKIGRAKKGRAPKRIKESAQEIKDANRKASKFSFLSTKSVEKAKKLETKLIKKIKPPFNKEEKGK